MTTWTSISGAAVAVGGIPSSATVTALRDNPAAMAETATGAPVMQSGWHPVDKVSVGDGKDGLIYDFAVSGGMAEIVTPDFEDGYEYRMIGSEIFPASSSTVVLDLYKVSAGAYTTALTIGTSDTAIRGFDVEIRTPRLSLTTHMGSGTVYVSTSAIAAVVSARVSSTPGKLLRARIRFPTVPGTLSGGGKVWLLRRRDFTTLP